MTPQAPAGRYPGPTAAGRRRARWAMWALGVVAIAATVWVGLSSGSAPVTWKDVGFRVSDAAIEIDYDVSRPDPAVPVTCRLEALNQRYAQVGVLVVDVPPAETRTVALTSTVMTSERAVTGVVGACWVTGEDDPTR